jgi:hypothetical protein
MQHKSFSKTKAASGSKSDDDASYDTNPEGWSAAADDHWWATPFDWENSRDA